MNLTNRLLRILGIEEPTILQAPTYYEIKSSVMQSIQYVPETQHLIIKFNSGATYRYFDVPEKVFLSLIEDKSAGHYFNHYIKNIFNYDRIGWVC